MYQTTYNFHYQCLAVALESTADPQGVYGVEHFAQQLELCYQKLG